MRRALAARPPWLFAADGRAAVSRRRGGERSSACSPKGPRAGERGEITWVTVLLLMAAAGAGYLAYAFGPVYVLHYEVKQVVREYANQAWRNPNDAELVENMAHKIRTLFEESVPGADGRPARRPAVDVRPQDVVWERDPSSAPPTVHVAFEYTREVRLPFVERSVEKVMAVDMTVDIGRPDWGPER